MYMQPLMLKPQHKAMPRFTPATADDAAAAAAAGTAAAAPPADKASVVLVSQLVGCLYCAC
jgi:hypothetical protein